MFGKLAGRLALEPDAAVRSIADDVGAYYIRGTDGFLPGWYSIDAARWLAMMTIRHEV
jgi:hypothetical protein